LLKVIKKTDHINNEESNFTRTNYHDLKCAQRTNTNGTDIDLVLTLASSTTTVQVNCFSLILIFGFPIVASTE